MQKKKNKIVRVALWTLAICLGFFVIIEFVISNIALNQLLDRKVYYSQVWSAEQVGLPAPDTLHLKTSDDVDVVAMSVIPQNPKAVVLFLTGVEKPSVTAFWAHAKMYANMGCAPI